MTGTPAWQIINVIFPYQAYDKVTFMKKLNLVAVFLLKKVAARKKKEAGKNDAKKKNDAKDDSLHFDISWSNINYLKNEHECFGSKMS